MTSSSSWVCDLTTEGIEPNPGPGCTAPHCRCSVGEVDFAQHGGWVTVNEAGNCSVCNHGPDEHENRWWQNLVPSPERQARFKEFIKTEGSRLAFNLFITLVFAILIFALTTVGIILCQHLLGAHYGLLWLVLAAYFQAAFNLAIRCCPLPIARKKLIIDDEFLCFSLIACYYLMRIVDGIEDSLMPGKKGEPAHDNWSHQAGTIQIAIYMAYLFFLAQLTWEALDDRRVKPAPRLALLSGLVVIGIGLCSYLISNPYWLWIILTTYLFLALLAVEHFLPPLSPVKPAWLLHLLSGLVLLLVGFCALLLEACLLVPDNPSERMKARLVQQVVAALLAVFASAGVLWIKVQCSTPTRVVHAQYEPV